MSSTTIKVSTEVRDRLKLQAAAAHRTLGDHLAYLADMNDRRSRFAALREAIDATPVEAMADYHAEAEAWGRLDHG